MTVSNLFVGRFPTGQVIDSFFPSEQSPACIRFRKISERVQAIFIKMVRQNGSYRRIHKRKPNIKITLEWSSKPAASRSEPMIYVPYIYLLGAKELPKQYWIRQANDPRIHSKQFLADATKWAIRKVHRELRLSLPQFEEEYLEKCLQLMQHHLLLSFCHPKLYDRAIDFVLAHEVAHVYVSQYQRVSLDIDGWSFFRFFRGSIGKDSNLVLDYESIMLKHRLEEKKVDILAIRAVPEDIKGAIHFFQIADRLHQLKYPQLPYGDIHHKHPTPMERIEYLKKLFTNQPYIVELGVGPAQAKPR